MAEAFALTTAGLGLLGVIDASMNIGGKILKTIQDFRTEKEEQKRLISELSILQAMLPLVKDRLESAKYSGNPAFVAAAKALAVSDGSLAQYEQALQRIEAKLEKASAGTTTVKSSRWTTLTGIAKSSSGSSSPTLRRRLAWPSTLSNIHDELERIGRFQSTLIVFLTAGAPAAEYTVLIYSASQA